MKKDGKHEVVGGQTSGLLSTPRLAQSNQRQRPPLPSPSLQSPTSNHFTAPLTLLSPRTNTKMAGHNNCTFPHHPPIPLTLRAPLTVLSHSPGHGPGDGQIQQYAPLCSLRAIVSGHDGLSITGTILSGKDGHMDGWMDGWRDPADTGARHVGQPVEVFPLDAAHGLDHVRLRRGCAVSDRVCGVCHRGESPIPFLIRQQGWKMRGLGW